MRQCIQLALFLVAEFLLLGAQALAPPWQSALISAFGGGFCRRRRCAARTHPLPIAVAADVFAPHPVAFGDDHLGDDVVEEGAVVADQKHGAAVLFQQFFQQFQRIDVEVVGRFVQHQQLAGLANRRASNRRLRSPPDSDLTGERARSGANRKSPR